MKENINAIIRLIGAIILSIIAVSIPALFILAIVYDWGFAVGFVSGALTASEIVLLTTLILIKTDD